MFSFLLEGRDKIVKLFQYFTKFCSWYYLKKNAEISVNYFLVSEKVREARQLFRIFKSFFEFKRIQIIHKSNTDNFLKVTNIISRSFYLLYWLFDNIYIFSKAANLHKTKNFPIMAFRRLAKICWMAGLSLFLVICCKIIRKTYTDESDLKVAALNKMTVK